MAKYGVWMLERLVLRYSERGGSSRGMRAFIESGLPHLQANNPQLQIEVKGSQAMGNGRSREVCVRNFEPDKVAEEVYWLRNSHGRAESDKIISSRHLSRQPSVQGPWTSQTFLPELKERMERRRKQAEARAAIFGGDQ